MPPTSTRRNQVARCEPVRCERSSCQFFTAMTTLATTSARNSATNRYFHAPSALWSSVFPIKKSQKSDNGLGMDRLQYCCSEAGTAARYRGLFADAHVGNGGQRDFAATLVSFERGNEGIEHRPAVGTQSAEHGGHSRRERDAIRNPTRGRQAPAL